jgi:hypothetical protein
MIPDDLVLGGYLLSELSIPAHSSGLLYHSRMQGRGGAGWRRAQLCGPQARLKSCRPITLKKLGAAIGAAAQELQSARKMASVSGHDQR